MTGRTAFPLCCAVDLIYGFLDDHQIGDRYIGLASGRQNIIAIFTQAQKKAYFAMCTNFKLLSVTKIRRSYSNPGNRYLALCVFERKS